MATTKKASDADIAALEAELDDGGEDEPLLEDETYDTPDAPKLATDAGLFPEEDDDTEEPTEEPDHEELERIGAEMMDALNDGSWGAEKFRELYARAKVAARGHEDYLEFLVNEADDSW